MKRIALLLGVVVALFSCNSTHQNNTENAEDASKVIFVSLQDLQAKGAELVGKEIETQGIVDHVCRHGGKKILLVADGVDVHVVSENRFSEDLMTKELKVRGVVKEDRTDEASLLKIEEDAVCKECEKEDDKSRQERIINYVKVMRDSLKNAGVDHFSEYYLEYVSHEEVSE